MRFKSIFFFFNLFFINCLFIYSVNALDIVNFEEKLDGYIEKTQHYKIEVRVLEENFNHPWAITWLNNNRVLISERRGRLVLLEIDSEAEKIKRSEIFGFPDTHSLGQGGLLDLETHPNYLINGLIYATYSSPNPENPLESATTLARFRIINNQVSNLEVVFQSLPYKQSNRHFGSRIAFDSLARVYITSGDRGERVNAQDLGNHIGKTIRLKSDGTIPEDNPFFKSNSTVEKEKQHIFSYGHRNPQGLVFYKGKLFAHEHGPQGGDEFNVIESGKNYGWPQISYGKEYLSGLPVGDNFKEGMEQPLVYWSPSIAPSGLIVYDGSIFKNWQGDFFLGSLVFGQIHRLKINDKNQVIEQEQILDGRYGRIRDLVVGSDGLIYFITDAPNALLVQIKPTKIE